MDFVFISFVFLSLFFAFQFLIKSKGDKLANRLIAFLLILFGFSIFYSLISWNKQLAIIFGENIVHLDFTIYLATALLGPIFFFYLQRVLKDQKNRPKYLLHFFPFLLVSLCLIRYLILPIESKIDIRKKGVFEDYIWFSEYLELFVAIIISVYSLKALMIAYKARNQERDILIWTKAISFSFLGLASSFVIYTILSSFEILTLKQDHIISLMMVFFVGLIGYFAFAQPDIFNGKSINKIIPFVKYRKSGLSKEYSAELKRKLIDLMEKQHVYLDNEVDLQNLANELNVSRNHTSQVINQHFKMSFYDFLNSYRVQHAIKLMAEGEEELSCNEIAYSVGFNNRISFYKAFKKITHHSPNEYRKSISLPKYKGTS